MRESRGVHGSTVILYNHESPIRPATFVTRKITKAAASISLGLQDRLVLGNIDVSRDWGFAGDYVDAMVRAVRHDVADDYVVATGESHSLRDLVAIAFDHAGISDWEPLVTTESSLTRPGDIASMVGNPSKARTQLGWQPTTDFRQLIGSMVDADLERLRRSSP
jgi:GDPmannose 4,6-dehydratase